MKKERGSTEREICLMKRWVYRLNREKDLPNEKKEGVMSAE